MRVFKDNLPFPQIVIYCTILIFTVLQVAPFVTQAVSKGFDDDTYVGPLANVIEVQGALIACLSATFPIIFDVLLDYLSNRQVISVHEYVPRRELFIAIVIPDLVMLFYLVPNEKYPYISCLYDVRDTFIIWGFLFHLWKLQPEVFHVTSCGVIGLCLSLSNCMDVYANMFPDEYYPVSLYLLFIGVILAYCEIFRKSVELVRRIRFNCIQSKTSMSNEEFISCVYLGCFISCVLGDWIVILIPQTFHSFYWQTSGPYFLSMNNLIDFLCIIVIMVFATRMARSDMANREQELKIMLVGYFSHEIRTPLNSVVIGVQVIRKELTKLIPNTNTETRIHRMIETVQEIELSSGTAITILDDMLLFEQLERGVESLNKADISVQFFLEDCFDSVTLLANSRDILLKCRYLGGHPYDWSRVLVHGDNFKLTRMVKRLLSNAIQMSHTNTEVLIDVEIHWSGEEYNPRPLSYRQLKLYTEAGSFMVLIHIADNGATISEVDIKKMFSDGISFTTGVLNVSEGLGLSLWIARKLMLLHGGNLSFSPCNQYYGNRFTISIPGFTEANDPPPNIYRRLSNIVHNDLRRRSTAAVDRYRGDIGGAPLRRSRWPFTSLRSFFFPKSSRSNDSVKNLSSSPSPPKIQFDEERYVIKNTKKRSNPNSKQQLDSHRSDPFLSPSGVTWTPNGTAILVEEQATEGEVVSFQYNKVYDVLNNFSSESLSPNSTNYSVHDSGFDNVREFRSSFMSVDQDNTPKAIPEIFTPSSDINEHQTNENIGKSHSDNAHTETNANSFERYPRNKNIILVVDDAIMNQKMMYRLLTGYCDKVVTADDGVEAIEAFKRSLESDNPFSLILMDYQMPNMDGPTAAKAIRELGFKGPIIGVTGNTMQHQINTFLHSGADCVLPKPLHFDVLLQTLLDMDMIHVLNGEFMS